MDEDEIIEMARQAGLPDAWISNTGVLKWSDLEAFAKLVEDAAFKRWAAQTKLAVQDEREACAKVCGEIYRVWVCEGDEAVDYPDPHDCMRAIRARGEA